ncbi:MAG: acyltransferase, partial [Nonomuraea sp.]|nr:acyltransferase [Nonomuraea sp.]
MTVLLDRPIQRTARDPFVDVLRVFGMALVVLQHWTIPVLAFDGRALSTGNALSTPGV